MLLKLCGSLFVMIACGLLGLRLSNEYEGRIIRLNNFEKMIKVLKNEIAYNNESILEAINRSANSEDKYINQFLFYVQEVYKEGNISLKQAWIVATDSKLKKVGLKESDLDLIRQIGTNLGVTCRATQLDYIDNFIAKIEMVEEELYGQKEEKCKLYKSMGVMTGLFIVILFI